MRIVCQQTILMKDHALFVNFENEAKFNYQGNIPTYLKTCWLAHKAFMQKSRLIVSLFL